VLLPLNTIKGILGIPAGDTSYDEALTRSGEAITRQMEAYCDRGFEYVEGAVIELLRVWQFRLYLERFPIQELTELKVNDGVLDPATLFKNDAWGWIDQRNGCPFVGDVLITANLGYPPEAVPADLALAFARAVGTASGYGTGEAGSSGGASSPIKTLGLGQGAIAIGFDTGKVASGSSGTYDVSNVPVALQGMADVLQFYRRFHF
jgi:hypothetical protein